MFTNGSSCIGRRPGLMESSITTPPPLPVSTHPYQCNGAPARRPRPVGSNSRIRPSGSGPASRGRTAWPESLSITPAGPGDRIPPPAFLVRSAAGGTPASVSMQKSAAPARRASRWPAPPGSKPVPSIRKSQRVRPGQEWPAGPCPEVVGPATGLSVHSSF